MNTFFTPDRLRSLFQNQFNLSEWLTCLQQFFLADELRVKPEPLDTTNEQGYYLGAINTPDHYHIGLFHYVITHGSVVNRRVGLRKLVEQFTHKRWGDFDAALVVFSSHDHWRLSLICDIDGEATSPKRFTYVFGSRDLLYRTPIERFSKLQKEGVTFAKMREAFSVEALSDEFFERYREQYADFVEYVTGKRYVKSGTKWVERVMGPANEELISAFKQDEKRVRDYIKKMMGRITFLHFLQRKGWMCGDLNYMQHLFERSPYQDNYLDAVLEPLFFGILNTRPEEREALFTAKGWNLNLLSEWKSIPYLNGGLFECEAEDLTTCRFPVEYFQRLFQFFSEYNFTIDENDPTDAEVGVDPEMLGKIFENLLEDNKDKGAFYTPKEIVRYMCRESLIAYLETSTSLAKDKIRQFVFSPEEGVTDIPENKKPKLLAALEEVKICDPAIGSGAFPMGLLNELLHCREVLSSQHYDRAEIKKSIIQNNIYGVDIEKGAVDIARLRFWLSIVVDEETPSPLPNLDYKIMQGNSLIESFMGVDLSKLTYEKEHLKDNGEISLFDDEKNRWQKTVSHLLSTYYSCNGHDKKVKLRQQIADTINKQLASQAYAQSILDEIRNINLAGNNQFFLWHTWFSDVFNRGEGKNGFDIVIGNPPYISYYSRQAVSIDSEVLKDMKSSVSYITDKNKKGRYHSVQFFLYKSLNLINASGTCNLIIDFSFFEKPFADIRKYILTNYHIREIVTGLTAFEKVSSGQLIISLDSKQNTDTVWKENLDGLTQRVDISLCKSNKDYSISKPNQYGEILCKIENQSIALEKIGDVRTGVNIGGVKDYFLCDDTTFPPYISGGDNIQAFQINYPTKLQKQRGETNFIFDKSIEKYIWDNKIGTPSIGESNERFIRSKLIIRQSDVKITAAIDLCNKFHCGYSLFTVNVANDDEILLLSLLCILNSKLVTFYMLNKGWIKIAPGKNPQIRVEHIKKIPISCNHNSEKVINKLAGIANLIINPNYQDKDHILKEMNYIVYKIYELSDNEINIIEKSMQL